MFPLKSLPEPRRKPYCTWTLVFVNILAFMAQGAMHFFQGTDAAVSYGVIPARYFCYLSPAACGIKTVQNVEPLGWQLLTSMFLHADLLHLGFNMLFLWIFGTGLEDKLGKFQYLLVYFGGGILAAVAHIVTHLDSASPVIGASGAIAAVLGAYLIVLPKAWVLTYIPPIFFVPVPAPLFLALWAAFQAWNALHNIHIPFVSTSQGGGVAWVAHLGGFAAGALYGWRTAPWGKKRRHRSARSPVS